MAPYPEDKKMWRSKDWLFPLGGTVFGVIVLPVAIAQYPNFFNENLWVLPVAILVVLFCWVVPFLLHDRTRRTYRWITAIPKVGYLLFLVIVIIAALALIFGGRSLFRVHKGHLSRLIPAAHKPEESNPTATPAPKAESPKPLPRMPRPKPSSPFKTKPSAPRSEPSPEQTVEADPCLLLIEQCTNKQLIDKTVALREELQEFTTEWMKDEADIRAFQATDGEIAPPPASPEIAQQRKRYNSLILNENFNKEHEKYAARYHKKAIEIRNEVFRRIPLAREVAAGNDFEEPYNIGGINGIIWDLTKYIDLLIKIDPKQH
jgi:hypothetical protein